MAPSLCVIPMPPRITRKSTRPRASDRSMVDTVQPQGLFVSKLIGVVATRKMKPLRWITPGTGHQNVSMTRGLDVANQTRASGEGRTMFLTSPFIDQAISLKTRLLA
jgi:hypothetical protein